MAKSKPNWIARIITCHNTQTNTPTHEVREWKMPTRNIIHANHIKTHSKLTWVSQHS